MKKFNRGSVYSLLIVLTCLASCSAQVKKELPNNNISASKTFSGGTPKLKRTQGTNEYANVYCSLMDKEGNLWFGTSGEGIYRYDGKLFVQFTVQDGLVSNIVRSLLEDKEGNLWIGTDSGLCRYDYSDIKKASKKINSVAIPFRNGPEFFTGNSSNYSSSSKNGVWSILQDKSGKLWFGTLQGVYCYDGISFTRFLDNNAIINNSGLRLEMIDWMTEDKNGNIWFCSGRHEGVCRYDGKSIINFKPNGDGWIRTILEDKDGNILIATRHYGVCRFDGKSFINFTETAGIDNSSVCSIFQDKKGNLWIPTELGSGQIGEDGGVWRYDPSPSLRPGSKSFTRFTTKDGLIHNGVFCVVEDKSGNLWFGTRNIGLCKYDGKTFTSFSE